VSTDHDHGHPHRHPPQPDIEDMPATYHQFLAQAVGDLLIEKGIITADELRGMIEFVDTREPAIGARLVAHAWADPDFKARLLADSKEAAAAIGIDTGPIPIIVVENTDRVHNVIVCTLCSCYPTFLIGLPPDWYKARAYRSRCVREPRAVLREFGTEIPESKEVRVHDSTADMRYLVLPQRPDGTDGLDEEALAGLVTRDCMIGVTLPRAPAG